MVENKSSFKYSKSGTKSQVRESRKAIWILDMDWIWIQTALVDCLTLLSVSDWLTGGMSKAYMESGVQTAWRV